MIGPIIKKIGDWWVIEITIFDKGLVSLFFVIVQYPEAWISGYIFQEHLLLGFNLCIESWISCYILLGDKSVSLLFFLMAIIDSIWKSLQLLKTNT